MAFLKEAQNIFEGEDIPVISIQDSNALDAGKIHFIPISLNTKDDDLVVSEEEEEEQQDEDVVDMKIEDKEPEEIEVIQFHFDKIPGAEDQSELPVEEEGDLEVSDSEVTVEEDDIWNWKEPKNVLKWAKNMLENHMPKHTGHDLSGVQACIRFHEDLLSELSRALRADRYNDIDVNLMEELRFGIHQSIERLKEREEQIEGFKYKKKGKKDKKKKAFDESDSDGFVKEAQKSTKINGISICVDMFISGICRIIVNAKTSAGKDPDDIFDKLNKKYKFSDREVLEINFLLSDMGVTLRKDRGKINEEFDSSSEENMDFAPNYLG